MLILISRCMYDSFDLTKLLYTYMHCTGYIELLPNREGTCNLRGEGTCNLTMG
jgi:hypothetical protein